MNRITYFPSTRLLFFIALVFVDIILSSDAAVSSSDNDPRTYFGNSEQEEYLKWYDTIGVSRYKASTFLSSSSSLSTNNSTQGAALHWTWNETHIALAVIVQAKGWVGFGLSENGGMRGSDVFLWESAQPDQIRDAHILDELVPITDCIQDWTLEDVSYPNGNNEDDDSTTDSDYIIVQVTRVLDTHDTQDRPIVTGTDVPLTRIIVAWGDTSVAQYHGPNHRVRGAVQWVQDDIEDFPTQMELEQAQTFRVAATNYSIPKQKTHYAHFCFTSADAVSQGVPPDQPISIIGIEPLIDADRHVHHLTIYGFPDGECESMERSMVYVWGPGEQPMVFPKQVGLYAGKDHFQSFFMEVHYDNVDLISNVQDSTAVQFYYTTNMRPIEGGILQLGDPFVQLSGIPVGVHEHIFECPASCTETFLKASEPVTILREYLHMHAHGVQAQNEVLRKGEVIHRGSIDYFDFNQQGNQAVQQKPYQVEAGDSFRTTCRYQSSDNETVTFGLASQEEMCIVFILYYPRRTVMDLPWTCAYDIPFDFCSSTWNESNNSVSSSSGGGSSSSIMPRIFGTTNATECSSSSTSAAPASSVSTSRTNETAAILDDENMSSESPTSDTMIYEGFVTTSSTIVFMTMILMTMIV